MFTWPYPKICRNLTHNVEQYSCIEKRFLQWAGHTVDCLSLDVHVAIGYSQLFPCSRTKENCVGPSCSAHVKYRISGGLLINYLSSLFVPNIHWHWIIAVCLAPGVIKRVDVCRLNPLASPGDAGYDDVTRCRQRLAMNSSESSPPFLMAPLFLSQCAQEHHTFAGRTEWSWCKRRV